MSPVTSAQVLARAEARAKLDPEFASLLARLVDAPAGAAGDLERVAAGEVNQRRHRDAVEEFRSGSLTTSAVQELLGVGTPQAVHRLRSRRRLIGAQLGNNTWFPSWQFAGGRIRPDLPKILEALGRFSSDPIAADRIMRLRRDDLGGSSVAGALDRPRLSRSAWSLLAELAS